MNTLTYKGYGARIEFDEDDEIFTGRIAGVNDIVGFHGESVGELKSAFHEAVEDYVEAFVQAGKEPQKPFSGKVMFRISPEKHRKAVIAAELSGMSLNAWAEDALEKAAK